MRFHTDRLRHLLTQFPPGRGGLDWMIHELADVVIPVVDALGTSRFGETADPSVPLPGYATATNNSGAGVATIDSTPVPAGIVRYVLDVSATHTDVARDSRLSIIKAVSGVEVFLATILAMTNFQQITLPRTMVLGPGDKFRLVLVAITAGQTCTIKQRYVDVPVGELINLPG